MCVRSATNSCCLVMTTTYIAILVSFPDPRVGPEDDTTHCSCALFDMGGSCGVCSNLLAVLITISFTVVPNSVQRGDDKPAAVIRVNQLATDYHRCIMQIWAEFHIVVGVVVNFRLEAGLRVRIWYKKPARDCTSSIPTQERVKVLQLLQLYSC